MSHQSQAVPVCASGGTADLPHLVRLVSARPLHHVVTTSSLVRTSSSWGGVPILYQQTVPQKNAEVNHLSPLESKKKEKKSKQTTPLPKECSMNKMGHAVFHEIVLSENVRIESWEKFLA